MALPRINVDQMLARAADGPSSRPIIPLATSNPSQKNPTSVFHIALRQPQPSCLVSQNPKPNGFQFKDDSHIVVKPVAINTPPSTTRQISKPNSRVPGPVLLRPNPLNPASGSKRPTHFSPPASPAFSPKRRRLSQQLPDQSVTEDIPPDFFDEDEDEELYMNELHGPPPSAPLPNQTNLLALRNPTECLSAGPRVVASTRNPHAIQSDQPHVVPARTPLAAASSVSTPRQFAPVLSLRGPTAPTLQEMDMETLYIKRHECLTKIKTILEQMVVGLQGGGYAPGEDFGSLDHSRSYSEKRLNEFNAELEHRRTTGHDSTIGASVAPPLRTATPLDPGTLGRKGFTSPSTSSRVSSEPVQGDPVTPAINHRNQISRQFTQPEPGPSRPPLQERSQLQHQWAPNNPPRADPFANRGTASPLNYPSKTNHMNSTAQNASKQAGQSCLSPPLDCDIGLLENIFDDDANDTLSDFDEPGPGLVAPSDPAPKVSSARLETSIVPKPNKTTVDPVPSPPSPFTDLTAPKEDMREKMKYPWSADVAKALVKIFKLKSWRRNQLDAINATLSGKHCFVLMPTGGGKSLCYQLPAVVRSGKTRGVTIVISPLLSLITDQVQALCDKDIGAAAMTGSMTEKEKMHVINDLKSPEPTLCLVYATPELIMNNNGFVRILEDLQRRKFLARFVIDEAHCVSQWGHDFRPDYKSLGPKLAHSFKDIPILALTATANSRVQKDVLHNLGMRDCIELKQSFNRPNLRYEVRLKTKETMNDLIKLISVDHSGECGIIYCGAKKQCETVAEKLNDTRKIRAHHYHAGMSPKDRQRIQHEWQNGVLQVICATIAFGMGIDKPDVRYVIHYSMPSSLEGYYQETGRAGRDGRQSECILFYSYSDFQSFQRMVDQGDSSREQKERQLANARLVVGFCLNKLDCRRALVLSYFSEDFSPQGCKKTCDNCMVSKPSIRRDVTDYVKSAIKLVEKLTINSKSSVTLAHCVNVFKGSKMRQVVDQGHHLLEEAGAGSTLDRTDVERLFQLMVAQNIFTERHEANYSGFTNAYIMLAAGHMKYLKGERLMMTFEDGTQSKRTKANQANVEVPQTRHIPDPKQKKAKAAERAAALREMGENDDIYVHSDQDDYDFEPEVISGDLDVVSSRRGVARNGRTQSDISGDQIDSTQGCYKALINLRNEKLADGNDDAFRDDVVQTVACLRPQSEDRRALQEIEGIDQNFVSSHGTAVLKICERYNNPTEKTRTRSDDRASERPAAKSAIANMSKQLQRFAAKPPSTRPKAASRTSGSGPGGVSAMPIPR
ncbi:hypothetical protein CROQUDRAFT_653805 [Cronartium quercuum f. sp. fusiforme G11]|uniref:DNA 3'-5' helicase n=1 Tax=Cronartium quercuum f. sp. fusiforme G11 TaxID=708437 RepID=A0A9P6NS57_9BASI|nr:hypothetical protein CROQUDRAFT_653805 [Cronartium quercuum f. sp. fusiforme G11]